MKIWTNTNTLEGLIDDLEITQDKTIAEIALLGGKTLNIEDFPNLKAIFRAGVGKENVPEQLAATKNIICRFPSAATIEVIFEETANFACSLILRAAYQKVGTLDPWVKFNRPALNSQILLIIGQGNIGKKVTNKLASFFKILTYDIQQNSEEELRNFLKIADIISIHIPAIKDNIDFIDADKLSLMKDGTSIINTARGYVVNEDALYNEIEKGRLKALFDVFWQEPYLGKLKDHHPDSFFMTPHIASTCSDFLESCANDLRNLVKELKYV